MGDRAIVLFKEDGEIEPFGVYFHWAGAEVVKSYAKAALKAYAGRRSDAGYFAARFVGLACADMPGETGIGLVAAPTPEQYADPRFMRDDYSHGGAGVAVFDPKAGTLTWIKGTGYGKGQVL